MLYIHIRNKIISVRAKQSHCERILESLNLWVRNVSTLLNMKRNPQKKKKNAIKTVYKSFTKLSMVYDILLIIQYYKMKYFNFF